MKTENIGKKDGLDEVLSVEPDRDAQPDQTWLVRPDTVAVKEDTAEEIVDDERAPVSDWASSTESLQLQDLLSVWDRASEEVQREFLASIGVSLIPQLHAGSGLVETEPMPDDPEPSHQPMRPQEPGRRAVAATRAVKRAWTARNQAVGE